MLTVAHFVYHGAFDDFFLATVTYNVRYSGETYRGPLHALSYVLTFPIGYARVDPLWLVGGAGCAGLLFFGIGKRALWLPVAWVAAACLSIAINGSRGLPQYFVQAAPALALAAGCTAVLLWRRAGRAVRIVGVVLVAIAVWRVGDFRRGWDYTTYDLSGALGRARSRHLSCPLRARRLRRQVLGSCRAPARRLSARALVRSRPRVRLRLLALGLRRLRSDQRVALLLEPSRHRGL